MDDSEKLFTAILHKNFTAADRMTAAGVTLDGDIKTALTQGSGKSDEKDHSRRLTICLTFDGFINNASAEEFAAVSEKLFELIGEPLFYHYNDFHYCFFLHNYYEPIIFETILKCYNGRSMLKQDTMREIIDKNSVELLKICAKYSWLKMPRIRDAMIEYSQKTKRTECTAWLLDFKNRTADLAGERERAEKRMLRELNASPNSLAELKKVWRFTKLEDGGLEITSYKGKQTEVVVPEKIGKDTVVSIGSAAFSGAWYLTKRTPHEVCVFRESSITKITLPETITMIGEYAFYYCRALKEVNIPNDVKVIENSTFRQTAIDVLELSGSVERLADYSLSIGNFKEVKLPQSLTEIGKSAFQMCGDLEKIEIPARVREILQGTFWRCVKLKEVVLPEGIETIRARAFWECPGLESIILPASIKKIENFKRDGKPQHIFADIPKLTATVEHGSYAEKYCAKNNIAYKYKEET